MFPIEYGWLLIDRINDDEWETNWRRIAVCPRQYHSGLFEAPRCNATNA